MKRTYLVLALTLFLSACFDAAEVPQPKYKASDILVTKEQKDKLVSIVKVLSDEKPKLKHLVYALSHSLNTVYAPRFADLIFSEAHSMNLDTKEYLHRMMDHKDDLETIVNLSIQAHTESIQTSVENTFYNYLIPKDVLDLEKEKQSELLKTLITLSATTPVDLSETLTLINQMTVIEDLSKEEMVNLLKNKMLIDL